MRYTKPAVEKVLNALSAIESTESDNPNKLRGAFADNVHACTINAYEADE
jgi:hypothetical protein